MASAPDALKAVLTAREAAVLWLLARGCTYAQAAERLGISLHTVASHVKNAYRKLDVHSSAAAVMRAVELQLLRAGDDAGAAPPIPCIRDVASELRPLSCSTRASCKGEST